MLQAFQDLFGRLPQVNSKTVDELKVAIGAELGIKRQFRIGRSKAGKSAARVVTDAADDGSPDARRAEGRMWLAAQRMEQSFKLVERAPCVADDLAAAGHQGDPVGVDGTNDNEHS